VSARPPISRSQIDAALAARAPRLRPASGLRHAAVLLPLIDRPTGVELLFIMRPQTMRSHAGQPAFPGGRVDDTDDNRWQTATREAHEELGITPSLVTPAGQLDDLPTISAYHVTPLVGWIPDGLDLRLEPAEVETVFTVPLALLADPTKQRTMRSVWDDRPARLRFYLTDPHVVWGASAQMLHNFLTVLAL
jgi:8-oxo-dGTP pyrophosphatase MutT (NUDIX family)